MVGGHEGITRRQELCYEKLKILYHRVHVFMNHLRRGNRHTFRKSNSYLLLGREKNQYQNIGKNQQGRQVTTVHVPKCMSRDRVEVSKRMHSE